MEIKKPSIHIYTDGGCRVKRERPIASCASVATYYTLDESYTVEVKEAFEGKTNNEMELMGVIIGLRTVPKGVAGVIPVHVYSDSAYVVNCFKNHWYVNWIKNNWISSAGTPVKNKELWLDLFQEVARIHSIKFHKVKGHSGDPGNERADLLVNIAMDELEKQLEEI